MADKKIQNTGRDNSVPVQGLGLRPIYVHRNMKLYGISESEIKALSTSTTRLSLWFGVGMAFLTSALSCFLSGKFCSTPMSDGEGIVYVGGTALFIFLTIVCFVFAVLEYQQKDAILKVIEAESESKSE